MDFKNLLAKIGENLALDLYRKKTNHQGIPDTEQVEKAETQQNNEAMPVLTLNGLLEKENAGIATL